MSVKQNWELSRDEFVQMLLAWESKSHDLILGFTRLFEDIKTPVMVCIKTVKNFEF